MALLMAYVGLVHFNRISITSAGTEHIMPEYGIDETSMGMVYSSYLFVYTFCMLPGGWLLDKYGPKRALMLVGFGSAVLVPLTGLAGYLFLPSPTTAGLPGVVNEQTLLTGSFLAGSLLLPLCLIRGLLGLISAPIHPSAARAISFWMPFSAQGTANGLVTGAAVTGIALTPFVFGFMMDRLSWPLAFIVAGIATLLLTIIWAMYATDHPDQHPDTNEGERQLPTRLAPATSQTGSLADSLTGTIELFRNRSLVLLTLSYAAASYFQFLFFFWQQYYFTKVLKLGNDEGRLCATIVTFAMVIGMMSGGWIADRMQLIFGGWRGRAITPIFGMLASGALLILGVLGTNTVWIVSCFALAMGALGLSEAPIWVAGIQLGRQRGGLSAAFLNAGGNVGSILAPIVTPIFSSFFGWKASLGLAAVICILGASLWFWIEPPEQNSGTSIEIEP